eukprot:CAMPEP_0202860252 /NCGR_PEP_ID=MMETSP1391-20130828/2035_1 /ASSEMBLY_ACC=CAM_ASM_000867 /TAXON_ID=1034604 /ORGANISM="Chlamydomonas leiostraca, Strain SAG 11-49" /LENGTH=357 /DNA_ID=CAMNT_0049539395 /DNA_START=134 /DNA_END=1207 /DNA_ORIENTATION=+
MVARTRVVARAVQTTQQTSVELCPLPRNVTEMVEQAVVAIKSCGGRRQTLELLNPVNEKAANFLSTEAMDYPCSNMKEFETLLGVTRRVLAGVAGLADESEVRFTRLDEGGIDGDLCGLLRAPGYAALVWPTAEKLPLIRKLAEESAAATLLLVNPLWKTEGNLVSEFGLMPWDRKKNEELVASFPRAYALLEQRIGAPSSVANLATGARYATGAVLRVMRSWPGGWAVHVMSPDGSSQVIGTYAPEVEKRPPYQELEALVNRARSQGAEIFKVATKASIDVDRPVAPPSQRDAESFYTRDQVLDMDAKVLRRVLMNLQLPTSGAMPKLQARALAVADGVAAGMSVEDAVEEAKKLR